MRVMATAMIRNEGDVVEAFVRHTLRFADALVVLDNGSTDATPGILRALQREGLPLVVAEDDGQSRSQGARTTQLYRRFAPLFRPDILLPLDADEFIGAPSRDSLEALLAPVAGAPCLGLMPWRTYVPGPEQVAGGRIDPPREITHRLRRESAIHKVAIPAAALGRAQVTIGAGNHRVAARGAPPGFGHAPMEGLWLAHYPVRSHDQLMLKILGSRLVRLLEGRDRSHARASFHQLDLYRRLTSDRPVGSEDVTRFAMGYGRSLGGRLSWPEAVVADPLPVAHAIRHTPARQPPTAVLLGRLAEQLLRGALGENTGPVPWAQEIPAELTLDRMPEVPERLDPRRAFDLPPFDHLARRHAPASVLQFASGCGAYARLFQEAGAAEVLGADHLSPRHFLLSPGRFVAFAADRPPDLGRVFDLVLWAGAAEGLPPGGEEGLAEALTRHAGRRILLATQLPGQIPMPLARWIEVFAARGWHPDLFDTLAVRGLATFPWFRNGLLVLGREEEGLGAAKHLLGLEERPLPPVADPVLPPLILHPFQATRSGEA